MDDTCRRLPKTIPHAAARAGVIYIATGQRYAAEAAQSLASLRRHEPDLPVTLFTDVRQEPPGFTSVVYVEDRRNHPKKVFHTKVACMGQSPYERTLFLDTDTHVCGTVREAFDLLDRFDFAGAHAPKRIPGVKQGLPQVLPGSFTQLNSGVLLFRKCKRVDRMLADWLRRYDAHDFPNFFGDQHELREALWASDVQLGILSTEWNCRLPWAFAVHEPVKILHGRHRYIDLVERRVNMRPNGVRAFTPVDFRPPELRKWAEPRAIDTLERVDGASAHAGPSQRLRPLEGNSASIFVVGPEGSGTTVLWRCIAAHPELRDMKARVAPRSMARFPETGLLLHLSLPTLRPMRWVHPHELPRGARVLTVRRSPVHTVYSAYRRFFRDPGEAWRAYFQAVHLESSYMVAPGAVSVAYEALVHDPAAVLRGVYTSLGVSPDVLPSVRLRDRNDDRWRADARFAEFMRSAFGDLGDLEPAAGARTRRRSAPGARTSEPGAKPAAEPVHRPARIVPARFVRIDGLLAPAEHERLLGYAQARERDFAESTVISADHVFRLDPEFRRSGTLHEMEDVWEMFDARLRRLLPYVRRTLELTWFPLGRVERQMAVHRRGGFFGAHADNTDPAVAGRCLTCVYYFHRRPKRFSGGELWLYETIVRDGHAQRGQRHVSVVPSNNTVVFFPSGVYHEVRPVRPRSEAFADSRFSVNVWFWSGEMPLLMPPPDAGIDTASRVRPRSRRPSRTRHLPSSAE
jgi:hypothetical protein